MKTYTKILLLLLLILDISTIIGIIGYNTSYKDTLMVVLFANLFLGPMQFIPALVLLFRSQTRSSQLIKYLIISIFLIVMTAIFLSAIEDSKFYRTYFEICMFTCYGLAHLHTFIIHSLYPKKISFLI